MANQYRVIMVHFFLDFNQAETIGGARSTFDIISIQNPYKTVFNFLEHLFFWQNDGFKMSDFKWHITVKGAAA